MTRGALVLVALAAGVGCTRRPPPAAAEHVQNTRDSSVIAVARAVDAAAPAVVTAARPPDFTRAMRGAIDDHLAVVMRLARSGDTLDGTYFYEPSTRDLRLHGTIAAGGAIHLDESSGKTVTGAFDGALDPSGAFTGMWTDAKRTRALRFRVAPVVTTPPAPVTLVTRKLVAETKPRKKPEPGTWGFEPTCKTDIAYVEVVGGFDLATEAKVNERLLGFDLPSTACDAPFMHGGAEEVSLNEGGVLSVIRSSDTFEAGMPHPSYGRLYINVAVPSGAEITRDDLFDASGPAVLRAALQPEIDKLDDDMAEMIIEQLAGADFAIEPSGLLVSTFNQMPHAYKGGSDFHVPWASLARARRTPGPLDRVWK